MLQNPSFRQKAHLLQITIISLSLLCSQIVDDLLVLRFTIGEKQPQYSIIVLSCEMLCKNPLETV